MITARYDATIAERNALCDLAEAFGNSPIPDELETSLRANYAAEVKHLEAISARPLKTLAELAAASRILACLIEEDAWIEHQPALARRIAADLASLAPSTPTLHS